MLKIFTAEFYSVGALFAVYGAAVMAVAFFRRREGSKQFFSEADPHGTHVKRFRTSGNAVVLLTLLTVGAYAALLALIIRLDSS